MEWPQSPSSLACMIHAVGNPPGPEGPTVSCLIVPSLPISSSEDIWTHFPRVPSHSPAGFPLTPGSGQWREWGQGIGAGLWQPPRASFPLQCPPKAVLISQGLGKHPPPPLPRDFPRQIRLSRQDPKGHHQPASGTTYVGEKLWSEDGGRAPWFPSKVLVEGAVPVHWGDFGRVGL